MFSISFTTNEGRTVVLSRRDSYLVSLWAKRSGRTITCTIRRALANGRRMRGRVVG